MVNRSRKPGPRFQFDDFIPKDEDPNREIAVLIASLKPGDLRLLEPLLELYGAELYRLAAALLERNGSSKASQATLPFLADVLASAIANPSSFRSEVSAREWLFELTIRHWRRQQRREAGRQLLQIRPENLATVPRSQPDNDMERRAWSVLNSFDDETWLATTLQYGWDFDAPAIARMTGSSLSPVSNRLNAVRGAVRSDLLEGGYKFAHALFAHYEYQQIIIDSLNGSSSLPEDQRLLLQTHLETCPDCLSYSLDLQRLETYLQEWFQARWNAGEFNGDFLVNLKDEVRKRLEKPATPARSLKVGNRVIQVVLLALLLVAADWAIRTVSGVKEDPAPLRPSSGTTDQSARRSTGAPEYIKPDNRSAAGLFVRRFDFTLDPAISADGRWLAYTWRLDGPNRGDVEGNVAERYSSGIVLTDLEENHPTQILLGETADTAYLIEMRDGKVNTAPLAAGISGQIVSPGLSADGRWLTFGVIQDVDRMSWRMRPCPSPENGCGVIVLYDRQAGSFELVSTGRDGGLPNGSVLQPVISADGRRVFYWSSASNLLSVDDEYCSSVGEPPYNCWDLFVYDRLSKSTERVPVGRRYEQLIWNGPVSVSADGRFVALTIHHDDLIAKQLGLDEAEVNVYWIDRENGHLQLANSRIDSAPGDELSVLPAISADGRYVAFTTRSGNLDESDKNGQFDVYLKDIFAGKVEWVSTNSEYISSDSSSGLASIADLVSGKFSQLGLTGEGRTVLYFSGISYGEDRESDWCLFYGVGFGRCGNIFYHDRQTGEFGPVLEAPEVASAYITPSISSEGRYVLAVYQYETCPAPYGCAEIWIYDREVGGVKVKLAVPELGKAGNDEQ